ncbi:MAG: thioredoxin family protein [Bacteroidota bacterium]
MKKLILFVSATFIASNTFSENNTLDSIRFDHSTWSELLTKAKKENKIIFLDCYTTWCGPCKWMAKNVFTQDEVADFYNANFINVKIDMEKGEGPEIAKKYGIQAYPTMIFVNADGEQVHRICGSSPADKFIETGKNALDPDKRLAAYAKTFDKGNCDALFASSYFTALDNACQSYTSEVEKYFSTQKESELTSSGNWDIIVNYVNDYSSKQFIYLETNKAAFSKLYTSDSVDNKISQGYASGLTVAIRKKDKEGYELLKTKLRKSGAKDAEKMIIKADLKLYQYQKDWKNYAATAVNYAESYAQNDANELNSISWTFYEHVDDKAMLEKAIGWMNRAVKINDDYALNDTHAAVLYKAGYRTEAKAAAEKAIELAKKSGEDYKETETLLDKINMLK